MNANYRILTAENRIKNAGTDLQSWFSLEDAKKNVDYSKDEKIYEYCMQTMEKLWEVL